tara:strand:+ start:3679 stop:4431 length:753 start_codon:yes stop_codon:yes gene_type:complete
MTNRILKTLVIAGAALSISTGTAQAGFLTFFGEDLSSSSSVPLATTPNADTAQANFLANLTGVGTENFEGFAPGASAPLPISFAGAGTATMNGSGSITSVPVGSAGAGRYGISGTNFWEMSTSTSSAFDVDLSDPTAAFGFYGIDVGDFGDQLEITLNDAANTTFLVPNTSGSGGSTDGSVVFFGFIGTTAADTFTSVTIASTVGGEVFAFDDFTIGSLEQVTLVPEPGALAIFGLGLLGLGCARRRRSW